MIGCDIVKIDRFEKLMTNKVFLDKYFSLDEQKYILSKQNKAQTMAGIFACKEAVLKALKIGIGGGILLKDVQVLHDSLGAPKVKLNGHNVQVSISHDGEYAFAVAIKTD